MFFFLCFILYPISFNNYIDSFIYVFCYFYLIFPIIIDVKFNHSYIYVFKNTFTLMKIWQNNAVRFFNILMTRQDLISITYKSEVAISSNSESVKCFFTLKLVWHHLSLFLQILLSAAIKSLLNSFINTIYTIPLFEISWMGY